MPENDAARVNWYDLARRCVAVYFVMWAGITFAGTLFGAFFFLVGAIVGFVLAGTAGAVTSFTGALLHFAMRGRLPLRVAASFAGATAGTFSWGIMGLATPTSDAVINLPNDFFPLYLITAFMGSLGGATATSLVVRSLRRIELGRPMRSRQFSLADMLLLTTWLAVVMTLYRLLVAPAPPGSYRDWMIAGTVLFAMMVAEGVYRLARRIHRPKLRPWEDSNAEEIKAFWRQYDQQMTRLTGNEVDNDERRSS